MVLLTPNFFVVQALEGLEVAGEEQGILKDIQKGMRDGEKEELVARAARELQDSSACSVNQQSGPYPMDFCISEARSMFRTPPISVIGSSCFLTTLGWLVTVEDGRHWNWCLRITGGHRCQGMLADTSPSVTCAFRPNPSDVPRPENSTLFPFHCSVGYHQRGLHC